MGAVGVTTSSTSIPSTESEIEGWRDRLDEFMRRRQRVATDRQAMAAARDHGKARRHAQRLRISRQSTEETDHAQTH